MTIKDTAQKVLGKVDKVISGFDDSKEKKHPGELEVDESVKAHNHQLAHVDDSRDPVLNQVPTPGSAHEAPGEKQSRDKPLPTN